MILCYNYKSAKSGTVKKIKESQIICDFLAICQQGLQSLEGVNLVVVTVFAEVMSYI